MLNHLSYKAKPIHQMSSLARALRLSELSLLSLAHKANTMYRIAKEVEKGDGTVRRTFDAHRPLKDIHRRIKLEILDKVVFPDYLTGSIKGRDYKVNAALHAGAKIVISEDIGAFFPSTTDAIVFDIWHGFFGFSHDVATCLTRLTTYNGELPQGAITSPQLANLVFWRSEPVMYQRMADMGLKYSRFVDDIAVSSRLVIAPEAKTVIISLIYGMMFRQGYRPKRSKHDISTSKDRMTVTKLTVNHKPGLASSQRSQIRAAVHALECNLAVKQTADVAAKLPSVIGKVIMLRRFHPGEGLRLKQRLAAIQASQSPQRECKAELQPLMVSLSNP